MSEQRSTAIKKINGTKISLQSLKKCVLYRIPASSVPAAFKSKPPKRLVQIAPSTELDVQLLDDPLESTENGSKNAASQTPSTDVRIPRASVVDVEYLEDPLEPAENVPNNGEDRILYADASIPSASEVDVEYLDDTNESAEGVTNNNDSRTLPNDVTSSNTTNYNFKAMEASAIDPDDAPLTISKQALREMVNEAITEQFKAIHEKLDKISQHLGKLQAEAVMRSGPNMLCNSQDTLEAVNAVFNTFKYAPVDSLDALIELNKKLNDSADSSYAAELITWMHRHIKTVHPRSRLTKAMRTIFTEEFLCHLSWTGRGKTHKIALSQFAGVIELFKKVGTTHLYVVDDREISEFFIFKLRYAVSSLERKKMKSDHLRR